MTGADPKGAYPLLKHRRVWVDFDPDDANGDNGWSVHPEQCRERGTWCLTCGCCEHCYHDCPCTDCGCGDGWKVHEPVLHVVEDTAASDDSPTSTSTPPDAQEGR